MVYLNLKCQPLCFTPALQLIITIQKVQKLSPFKSFSAAPPL